MQFRMTQTKKQKGSLAKMGSLKDLLDLTGLLAVIWLCYLGWMVTP